MSTQPSTQSPPSTANRARLLDDLFAKHGAPLRRQAMRHAPDPEAAADALQDACVQFLRAYREAPGVEPLTWMQTTTKRCAWAIARSRRQHLDLHDEGVEERLASDAGVHDPAHLAESAELREERIPRIERLKSDERTALIMLGLGCSYAEIGERRGWTYTKVNRCIAEGRASLRAAAPIEVERP